MAIFLSPVEETGRVEMLRGCVSCLGNPHHIPSRWLMLLRDGGFDGKDRAARSSVVAGAVGKEVESLIVLLVIRLLKITTSN